MRPRDKGDWLFTGLGHTANDRMSPGALALMLKRRAKQVGVAGPCSPHAFRHGFAVSYLMAGGDLASLADILGHSSIVVTRDFYSVFTSKQLRQKHAKHSPVAQMTGRSSDQAHGTD